jgi:hypothetical protein
MKHAYLVIADQGDYSDHRVLCGPIFEKEGDADQLIKIMAEQQRQYFRMKDFAFGWKSAQSSKVSEDSKLKGELETILLKTFEPYFVLQKKVQAAIAETEFENVFPSLDCDYSYFEELSFSTVQLPLWTDYDFNRKMK